MIWLGLRLALAGGRGSVVGIALTALAVALGTAILLFALSFGPALQDRSERAAWRAPSVFLDMGEAHDGVLMEVVEDRYLDEALLRVLVAPLSAAAPVPPGVPRLPARGEAFVSPALAARIAAVPADQLANRIGTVVGTIGDEALRSPGELVAIIGADVESLRADGASPLAEFATEPRDPTIPPIMVLVIVLAVAGALAPVAVFVATATRLSAARREQRLAALRLVGATPRQVTGLAVVEALASTVTGTLVGVALFFLALPLVALVPLDEATWFPEAIRPPLVQAIALLVAVPMVGAVAAIATLRRVVVTPLGVQRRTTPPPPGPLRLVPLAASVAILLGTLTFARREATDGLGLLVLGAAFAGVVGGIALAGPWLTALVGRALHRLGGGPAALLASRRLTDDPRGSFGSIAGVVMAVFVASAFFTFADYARGQSPEITGSIRPGQVVADLRSGSGPSGATLVERLLALPGVRAVLPIGAAETLVEGMPVRVWVVSCEGLIQQLDLASSTCGGGPIHPVRATVAPGRYELMPERRHALDEVTPFELVVGQDLVGGVTVSEELGGTYLPDLLIDPAAFGGLGDLPLSRLYVSTDGTQAVAERVRTAIAAEFPASWSRRTEERVAAEPIYQEFGRVVHLGLIGTLLLAGCSLAVAVTTWMLERRRQFALLRSAGMPASGIRDVVMLQAAAPLVCVAFFSALLGVGVSQAILRLVDAAVVPLPDASLAVTLAASVGGALAVVALMLPAIERLTRPDSIRLE